MGLLDGLATGFATAFMPMNVLLCSVGILAGMLIGVLPGIGTATALSVLLPVTFHLPPDGSLIMLAGIYYGAQYGGTITSVLVNIPGEASTIVTTLDGYQMARNGRAGAALTIAATGSFVAGCVTTLIIALFITPFAKLSLLFAPADYCSLMTLGLVMTIVIARGSLLTSTGMAVLGMLIGLVGTDPETGVFRFTFGIDKLGEGVDIILVVMGLFGITEVLLALEEKRTGCTPAIGSIWPTKEEWGRSAPSFARGTALGSFLGMIPGGGAVISSFAAYALEKQVSKYPERFGTGVVEGVAGPESANNAGAQASLIPLLAFGIPGNIVMALMAGALTVHGIAPGPGMWDRNPGLFWGLLASLWIGNLMLVVLNVPLVAAWVKLLSVPYRFLFPFIVLSIAFGAYSTSSGAFGGWIVVAFGLFGYACAKLRLDPVPLVLAMFLGPLVEENFRRAMVLSRGSAMVFVSSPISASILAFGAIVVALAWRARRDR